MIMYTLTLQCRAGRKNFQRQGIAVCFAALDKIRKKTFKRLLVAGTQVMLNVLQIGIARIEIHGNTGGDQAADCIKPFPAAIPAVNEGLPDADQGIRPGPNKFLTDGKDGKDKGEARNPVPDIGQVEAEGVRLFYVQAQGFITDGKHGTDIPAVALGIKYLADRIAGADADRIPPG